VDLASARDLAVHASDHCFGRGDGDGKWAEGIRVSKGHDRRRATDSTEILTLLIYRTAFSYLNMGRASAYSMILFVAVLAISLAQIWLIGESNRGDKR
jgi:ABC-type sugar transport system permease subunit